MVNKEGVTNKQIEDTVWRLNAYNDKIRQETTKEIFNELDKLIDSIIAYFGLMLPTLTKENKNTIRKTLYEPFKKKFLSEKEEVENGTKRN